MTVGELIAELQKLPDQDRVVCLWPLDRPGAASVPITSWMLIGDSKLVFTL